MACRGLGSCPASDRRRAGDTPDVTALYDEGCADVAPVGLVESWSRHTLTWLNRWQDEGNAPLHAEWMGLLRGVGEQATRDGMSGVFLGTDERFGMLLRTSAGTQLLPLTTLLEIQE